MTTERNPISQALLGVIITTGLAAGTAHAATYTVPTTHATIQDAVDAAVDGDVILIELDAYVEDVFILDKELDLVAEPGTTLEGFLTITGADAQVDVYGLTVHDVALGVEINLDARARLFNCTIQDCAVAGGILMNGRSLVMEDCLITRNERGNGGGGLSLTQGDLLAIRCDFIENRGTGANAFGGGVYVSPSAETVYFLECTFDDNEASGAGLSQGGAIFAHSPERLTIAECKFRNNVSDDQGGALFFEQADAVVSNCRIRTNTAQEGGGVYINNAGGLSEPLVEMTNCLISDNETLGGAGGGVRQSQDSNFLATNCTIVENDAAGAGGGIATGNGSYMELRNTIVSHNFPSEIDGNGTKDVQYSLVLGGYPGTGNIGALPQYVDRAGGDYRLSGISPAIDAGNLFAYAGLPTDAEGDYRALDDPVTDDTGLSVDSEAIDMGAFEYERPTPIECLTDLNNDGSTGFGDLTILLQQWGNVCP
jgi:hypothetical protein